MRVRFVMEGLQARSRSILPRNKAKQLWLDKTYFFLLFFFHLEKCLCPKKIYIGYYNKIPYTVHKDDNGIDIGIFHDILEDMIRDVCTCSVVSYDAWI